MSHSGVSKGAMRNRSSSSSKSSARARISKRLPGKTIWKGAVKKVMKKKFVRKRVTKKPAAKIVKRPAGEGDKRSHGRWLWAGVSVGHGTTRYTHGNQMKKLTWRILPHKTQALENKPRGEAELKKTFEECLVKGVKLVFDGWTASVAAAKSLGFQYAPPVVHDVAWRDATTGWHSNDIESEFSRLKHWNRARMGSLMITEADVHEYTFLINAGAEMSDIMTGLAAGARVSGQPHYF